MTRGQNFALEGLNGELDDEQIRVDMPGLEEEGEVEVSPRAAEDVEDGFERKHAGEDVTHESEICDYGTDFMGRKDPRDKYGHRNSKGSRRSNEIPLGRWRKLSAHAKTEILELAPETVWPVSRGDFASGSANAAGTMADNDPRGSDCESVEEDQCNRCTGQWFRGVDEFLTRDTTLVGGGIPAKHREKLEPPTMPSAMVGRPVPQGEISQKERARAAIQQE